MPYDPKPTTHHITARTGFRFRAGFKWQTIIDPDGDVDDPANWENVDLTGYTAKLMVKDDPEANVAMVTFETAPVGATHGAITLSDEGDIDISDTAAHTTAWPLGKFFYDLALSPPASDPLPFLKGNFVIEEGVTR